jgi:Tn3 transposase DDE domain
VMQALELVKRFADTKVHTFPADKDVPLDGVVRGLWRDAVVDAAGRNRVNRIIYEVAVLEAMREQLRCKEIWVIGANRYRNPDEDLPADFEAKTRRILQGVEPPARRESIHQLKSPSSSEVASMVEGVIHHCTEMKVDRQYVNSHGQSTVAFAFCRLLGFQLLPRLKTIHSQKLYRPEIGKADAYANLQLILSKPIDWELVRQQYDQMIKYTTALRLGNGRKGSHLAALHQEKRATPDL